MIDILLFLVLRPKENVFSPQRGKLSLSHFNIMQSRAFSTFVKTGNLSIRKEKI